ncbi:non-specific lipid-transfer protein-like protein At2g13820 [Cynara cardunculus var. scolymus]|uniref:non-specific lipid-transfer protein-like protein At2g13820 n=1 Tax=Cynara cardunculus var. scolymus TaxID=59895 RepID=UPI000D62A66A|nr:non-specific lipid-transfer protein-like protein At2g13820 [Cynara cardunculus var. scolymus]
MAFRCLVLVAIAVAMCSMVVPIYSQISTPCSPSMITSFTPCLNFITNSTTNATSTPTADCCNSLKTVTSSGTDCLCMIATGSVPFQIPINQSLAISLPRACRMPGVPLQCKAAAATPIPSPGPAALGPTLSPGSSSTVPEAQSPTSTPESNTTPALTPDSDTTPALTPPSTSGDSGVSTTNPASRPTVTPSAATSTYPHATYILATSGAMLMIKSFLLG